MSWCFRKNVQIETVQQFTKLYGVSIVFNLDVDVDVPEENDIVVCSEASREESL